MSRKQKRNEWITGVVLGLILAILFSIKVFASPAEVTDEEADMISRIVELESGNQSIEGRRMVAAVILNRVESDEFPDTIEEVLSQPKQFTTYRYMNKAEVSWQSSLATKMELETRSNRKVFFFRTGHYGSGVPLMQVGSHYFSTIK